MKVGIRKLSPIRSLKARTTGKVNRKVKSSINPIYGKKGMGYIKNPKKAICNKAYNKTSISMTGGVKGAGGILGYFFMLIFWMIKIMFIGLFYSYKFILFDIPLFIYSKITKNDKFNKQVDVKSLSKKTTIIGGLSLIVITSSFTAITTDFSTFIITFLIGIGIGVWAYFNFKSNNFIEEEIELELNEEDSGNLNSENDV